MLAMATATCAIRWCRAPSPAAQASGRPMVDIKFQPVWHRQPASHAQSRHCWRWAASSVAWSSQGVCRRPNRPQRIPQPVMNAYCVRAAAAAFANRSGVHHLSSRSRAVGVEEVWGTRHDLDARARQRRLAKWARLKNVTGMPQLLLGCPVVSQTLRQRCSLVTGGATASALQKTSRRRDQPGWGGMRRMRSQLSRAIERSRWWMGEIVGAASRPSISLAIFSELSETAFVIFSSSSRTAMNKIEMTLSMMTFSVPASAVKPCGRDASKPGRSGLQFPRRVSVASLRNCRRLRQQQWRCRVDLS